MGFTSIGGQCEYVKYNKGQAANGEILITGTYTESRQGKYTLDHYFKAADDGRKQCLNGCGHLDHLMEDVRIGWNMQVTYLGEITLDKGNYEGKMSHQFDIAIDDECLAMASGNPADINPSAQAPASESGELDLSKLM